MGMKSAPVGWCVGVLVGWGPGATPANHYRCDGFAGSWPPPGSFRPKPSTIKINHSLPEGGGAPHSLCNGVFAS